MTPQNLIDYVKIYDKCIDDDLCKKTIDVLQDTSWEMHSYHDPSTDEYVSYDHELSVGYSQTDEAKQITDCIWHMLQRYIHEFPSFHEWFSGWNGYTLPRFNKYDPTTRMRIHCDHIHTIFDGERRGIPTLTVLGALNNDYEGGEFVMFGDQQIDLPAGSIIIFPSNFMYPHEVKPVKSGVRYSYVSWAW